MGLLEAHVRHDLVLGHEAQAGTLQEVGAETHHAQLVRQALLVAGLAGEQLDALGRARVQLLVVAAEHGVQATNGLVVVQHIVRRGHAALGPLAQARHQVFGIAAVDGCAVGSDIGAGYAFHGDDQDIAKAIASSVGKRGLRGLSAADTFCQTMNRVNGFEAKCFANNISVLRMKLDPFARILLLVKEILSGRRDLTGFAPKPSDGERQTVGLSILAGRHL